MVDAPRIPKAVKLIWVQNLNSPLDFTAPIGIPQSTRWCPQPIKHVGTIVGKGRTEKRFCLALHDHSLGGDGYFYLLHKDSRGNVIAYTYKGACRRAEVFNNALNINRRRMPIPSSPLTTEFSYFFEGKTIAPCSLNVTREEISKIPHKKLVTLTMAMLHDWMQLNAIHNHRAGERRWCYEYENRQRKYNSQFKVLKLVGREALDGSQSIVPSL